MNLEAVYSHIPFTQLITARDRTINLLVIGGPALPPEFTSKLLQCSVSLSSLHVSIHNSSVIVDVAPSQRSELAPRSFTALLSLFAQQKAPTFNLSTCLTPDLQSQGPRRAYICSSHCEGARTGPTGGGGPGWVGPSVTNAKKYGLSAVFFLAPFCFASVLWLQVRAQQQTSSVSVSQMYLYNK